jgi:hypothetical protein
VRAISPNNIRVVPILWLGAAGRGNDAVNFR